MKPLKLALVLMTVFGGLLSASTADAHWRHRARVGVFIGAPIAAYSYYAWPRYYYPPPVYYAPPAYYAPPSYIEQTPPQVQSSNTWYYCRDSQAYYPYVQSCPSPWQPVVPR